MGVTTFSLCALGIDRFHVATSTLPKARPIEPCPSILAPWWGRVPPSVSLALGILACRVEGGLWMGLDWRGRRRGRAWWENNSLSIEERGSQNTGKVLLRGKG